MHKLREQALKLRLQGKSYNEIHAVLGIPKSTQNGWFRHLVLSDTAMARLKARTLQGTINAFVKRNKLQTHHAEVRARANRRGGESTIPNLSDHELRIIGATLYWAEGYKRLLVRDGKECMSHVISFVNSDAQMIRIFILFLKRILSIPEDKIRLSMRLYKHINERKAREYWTKEAGLPSPQFFKTTYLISGASKGTRPFNRLPWGTLQVQVADTAKFHHLLGMIDGVKSKVECDTISPLLG